MARYPMVVKGQKFVPNLHLENDLRRMVNATKRTGGKGTAKTFTIRIPVYNAGTTVIASGTAVNITGSPAYRHSSSPCLPFYDDKLPWGVLANSIDPQECGSCIISGPANVQISGSNGDYVQPNKSNPEVFIVAQSGVPIVTKTGEYSVINLGGSSSAVADDTKEYHGIFKMVALSTTTVQIINGRNIASAYCGATDVPGLESLPVTEIELDDVNEWQIFLAFFYDGKNYSARFVTALPENTVFSQLIGRFRCGSVEQIYQSDDSRMVFKDEWYL